MTAEQDRVVRHQVMELLQGGQVETAQAVCEEHLRGRPRDHEAMAMLAQIHFRKGRFDEASRTLAKALARDSKRADYQALMGEILTHSGRHREAIGRYDRALKTHPRFEGAIAGKAETLLRMGSPEKAIRFLDGMSLPVDGHPLLAIVKAKALVRLGEFAAAMALAERHLPGERLASEHRRSLQFFAGEAAEGMGDLDTAATRYAAGNALSNAGWDLEAAEAQRAAAESVFTREAMATLPRSDLEDDSPIFVVGLLRTGSTLTEQIIDAHPQAAGLGELESMPMAATKLASLVDSRHSWPAGLEQMTAAELNAVAADYLAETRRRAPRAVRRVDKQLGNFGLLGLIAMLFPKARIIHCRRHPLDAAVSCWTRKFAPGTNGWASTMDGIVEFHQEYEAWMDHWREVLPLPVLEVRYEHLVADLDGEARRIIDFCGLDWDDRCLRFWETGRTVLTLSADQVRQPLYDRSVGRHARWGGLLDPLRTGLAGAAERYEADDRV